MLFLLLLLAIDLRVLVVGANYNNTSDILTEEQTIEKLFVNYNKYSLPPRNEDNKRMLYIDVIMKDIFDISEQDESLTVRYYFFLFWNICFGTQRIDDREKHTGTNHG